MASHLLASLTWLAAGACGLVLVAPLLARGGFLDPRVIAVVHSFTLGVITTTIFGSLYQMLPALLGVSVRSVRAAALGLGFLAGGTLVLVAGLWYAWAAWQGAGWVLVAGAIGCASWTLLPQRRRATQGKVTGRYISAGHSALGLAFLLAGARIGEGLGWWHVERLGALAAHFHLAALGFATLTAVGVSSRLLPMFLAPDRVPSWPLRWIGPLAGLGLLVFSIGQLAASRPATLSGAALLTLAMAGYLALVATYFRHRTRPLDPALGFMAAAFLGLAATVSLGLAVLQAGGGRALARSVAAYVVMAVLGWLVLLILGVYYRVIPFLVWLNLGAASAAGRDSAGLMPRGAAWASLVVVAGGVWLMSAGIWTGSEVSAQAGACVFAAGVLGVLAQFARLVVIVRRSAPRRKSP
ncbi:MAG TPA: hypothetical protein VJQ46_03595 [Gemmatimonadales bacterium]|nr:hypothetical protein [Gemmatimonadales bacterium]